MINKHVFSDDGADAQDLGLETLRAYFPFTYSEKLDPRSVFSVGEQVQSEYLFASHARTSLKSGFDSVVSEVRFDHQNHIVTIAPRFPVNEANGSSVSMRAICDGVESSLQGTRHAPYASILKRVECDEDAKEVRIHFTRIPLNLKFLFTIPDFSIFNPGKLPLSAHVGDTATGPYLLESATSDLVKLRINDNYPKALRSNSVPNAELVRYNPSETKSFVAQMDPEVHHAAYFYGQALDREDRKNLERKGYKVDTFPTEWFVYLIVKPKVPLKLRQALQTMIHRFQREEKEKLSFGMSAYSISPSDRDFSLSEAEYLNAADLAEAQIDTDASFVVYTLENWAKIPIYAYLIEEVKKTFPKVRIEFLGRGGGQKIFGDEEVQIAISLLGISPSDPLTHFSFLETTLPGFSDIISKKEIAALSTYSDGGEFNRRVKDVEIKAAQRGLIIPVAHYPGVVAYRGDLSRDEERAFGWGIQTWSFRKSSR